ncbi:MAG: polysaccharide deacetylase family protein [Bacteroidota bacterium]|nr:polysaccharide deacetylase family protein [Bacteroidota bacterium]
MFTIFLPQITSRTEYIFEYIFTQQLGINFTTTSDQTAFEKYAGEKMNYSAYRFNNELFIAAHPLLLKRNIETQNVPVVELNGIKVLFPNDNSCDLGFDIFSAVFYMLSRYEEYLPFIPDLYGRFNVADSLAEKNNFLQMAVVDRWLNRFKIILKKQFLALRFKASKFEALLTYDIDVAYKFKGRGWMRTAGSIIKDLGRGNYKNIRTRFNVIQNKAKDPWDTYDYIEELLAKNNLPSIFFFLLGDTSKHDRNLDPQNPLMKKLVNKIASFSQIGIHPSFITSSCPEKILIEKERLEELSNKIIIRSRQHFLKFNLPETYNALIATGIKEDYSMGFPHANGFRAGTSKPFYFYDLKNEKITDLKIFPVTCMDATFIYYSKKTPEKSLVEVLDLLKEIKMVGGTFISIFHNDHLGKTYEKKSWKSVHNNMITQIKANLKKE